MQYLLLLCWALFFFSCAENPKAEVVVKGQSLVEFPVNPSKIKGMYAGEFKGSPIIIMIDHVTEKQAVGYDKHRGITRNLSGIVEFERGRLNMYLVEPGDSRFDGQFHLSIDTANWKGKGTWKSFVTGSEIPFRFQKRLIQKESDGQLFIDASSDYIELKPDGSCLYSYQTDSTNTAPPAILYGQYKKEKNKVFVQWKKNPVIPSGRSVFHLFNDRAFKGENYTQQSLRGEGRVFSEMVF